MILWQSERDRLLDKFDRELRRDINKAEKNLSLNENDLYHTGIECRRFAERLASAIIMRENPTLMAKTFKKGSETEKLPFYHIIKLIEREKLADSSVCERLHQIKNAGNTVHVTGSLDRDEAVSALADCKALADWFDSGIGRARPRVESFADFAARQKR